jgi:hypothetical protein
MKRIRAKPRGRKRRDNKKILLKRQELAACKNTTCSPLLNITGRSDNEWNESISEAISSNAQIASVECAAHVKVRIFLSRFHHVSRDGGCS